MVVGIASILTALAVPQLLTGLDQARSRAAVRYVAAELAVARALAVRRATTVAVLFDRHGGAAIIGMYADGTGDGVRVRDIQAGLDRPAEPPINLSARFRGVSLTLPGGGEQALLSFSPLGTATTGSLYVTGAQGSRYAVRVLGATGRVRIEQWHAADAVWGEVW